MAGASNLYEDELDVPFLGEPVQNCTLDVLGLPASATMKDANSLVRVFIMCGGVHVEKISPGFALITFDSPEAAEKAIMASGKIFFRGNRLIIKEHQLKFKYFDFLTNPNGENIIDPMYIDLKGNIVQQIMAIRNIVSFGRKDLEIFPTVKHDLQAVLRVLWPDCKATIFGSVINGIATYSSDVDCIVHIPEDNIKVKKEKNKVRNTTAYQMFRDRQNVFLDAKIVHRAPYTCFKLYHIPTGMYCRVTFSSEMYLCTSRLIKFLLGVNKSFVRVALVIKYWAQIHGFLGFQQIGTYAFMLIFIFYLQQPIACLPSIEYLQQNAPEEVLVDGWNVNFLRDYEKMAAFSCTIREADLLGGFFEFYATFNFRKFVLSPYLGQVIPKINFEDTNSLPDSLNRYKQNVMFSLEPMIGYETDMVVQDPFKLNVNLTNKVCADFVYRFQLFCRFAYEAYDQGKPNDFKYFLHTILHKTPNIPGSLQAKRFLFRDHIYENFENDFESWIFNVYNNLTILLEKVSRITYVKVVSKQRPRPPKYESIWMGLAKKKVWERPVSDSSYTIHFLVKESIVSAVICDDIEMSTCLTFNIRIWYTEADLCLNYDLSYLKGPYEDYLKFAIFFKTRILEWLYICSGPRCNELLRMFR